MKTSLNEVLNAIEETVNSHLKNIKKIKYLDSSDKIDITTQKTWPAIYVIVDTASSAQIDETTNYVNIEFWFLDAQVSKTNEDRKDREIKSDMMLTASILFDILQKDQVLYTNLSITLNPVTGRFNNGLSGWTTSVQFPLAKPCYKIFDND